MIKLQFPIKLISKDNEKLQNRQGRYFLSAKYKAFSEKTRLLAVSQYRGKPLEGDISVVILAGFKDKRHCDCGNLQKGICDDLQGICYFNDRQIKKLECIVLENEPRDSFVVTIEQIKKESPIINLNSGYCSQCGLNFNSYNNGYNASAKGRGY